MRFLNHTALVRRMLSGLLVLMLVLTNLSALPAAAGSIEELPYRNHETGVVNASFGLADACLLDGWTVGGDGAVTVVPVARNRADCMAVLTASNYGSAGPKGTSASLEQRFVVEGRQPLLRFFTTLGSDSPNDTFTPQTITLYDEANQIITQETLASPGPHLFERSLSAYVSQSVRLSLTVAVNPIKADGPRSMWMEVDFRMLEYGSVYNANFDQGGECTLAGWMVAGDVTLDTNIENENCFAVLSARQTGRSTKGRVSSSLDQTFVVSRDVPLVRLYLQAYSDKPDTDFPAQTVTLMDSNRNIIYHKSHNLQIPHREHNYLIELDLSDYVGQVLSLHIDVLIDSSNPNSPRAVSLKIDDQAIYDYSGPGTPPSGGW
jgi:hypothetical protein